jgi:hypothetical protein
MTKFLVYDAEYSRDVAGHALYQQAERYEPTHGLKLPAKDPLISPRWPFRTVAAIAWLEIEVADDGQIFLGQFGAVCGQELTEAQMLQRFFKTVDQLPAHAMLVGWGTGSSDDIQIRLAATRCGVRLPQRMIVPLQPGKRYAAGQLDLMVHVGGDGARVHLAEYCAALRIPAKVVAAPTAVSGLIASGNWSLVQAVCEGDVLSTAAALLYQLPCHFDGARSLGALLSLARLGAARMDRPYAGAFAAWQAELVRRESGRVVEALATLHG